MDRRQFFRLAAGAAGALIVPQRTIFLPPAGGWRPWDKFTNLIHFSGQPYIPVRRTYEFKLADEYIQILEPLDYVSIEVLAGQKEICRVYSFDAITKMMKVVSEMPGDGSQIFMMNDGI